MNKFEKIKKIVEEYLDKYIPIKYPESVYESIRYSVLSGGKRIRPVIMIETGLLYGAKIEELIPTACAIEMLHCQSLIHDDLPCMDNDDFRRGKPSNHKVYGESTAVLSGDAILSLAPEIIIDKTPVSIDSDTKLKILKELFTAAGLNGIISGQIVDIDSENKNITKETLEYIYEYKTSVLFKCAIRSGAIIAGVDEKKLQKLTLFAEYYGNAFQIYDDILDETATIEKIGKTPGKDKKSGKSTYVSMFGLKQAKKEVLFLCKSAYDILKSEELKSEILEEIVSNMIAGVL